MGIPTNIRTLLSGNVVEWARIEFKETWDAEASLKTICAFANDIDNWGGGYIVIGVHEQDGKPQYPLQGVPAEKIDGYLKDMLNKCKLIQPEYLPIVEVATVYKGNIIKNLIMDCQSYTKYAQTRLRAVFLYLGGERRNLPRGLTEKLSPFFYAQKQEVSGKRKI